MVTLVAMSSTLQQTGQHAAALWWGISSSCPQHCLLPQKNILN